jgi:hypothetical protein
MKRHTFSVTLKTKSSLTKLCIGADPGPDAYLEGELGEGEMLFLDDVLEVRGENGTLYLDLSEEELDMIVGKKKNGEKK